MSRHLSCLTPYKVPQKIDGRFLQWTALNYFLESQTSPIELCPPLVDSCDFACPDDTETYKIPAKVNDVMKWIMDKSELTIDNGSTIANLRIGLVREGVLVAQNIGTITEVSGSNQYYCTATIPCVADGCNYQIVIYDQSIDVPITCGLFRGYTLQQVIDLNINLGQVLNCTLNDFL